MIRKFIIELTVDIDIENINKVLIEEGLGLQTEEEEQILIAINHSIFNNEETFVNSLGDNKCFKAKYCMAEYKEDVK